MLGQRMMMAAAAGAAYVADAVVFDGSNDYLTRGAGLSNTSDGEFATVSVWVKLNGGNGANQRLFRSNTDTFQSLLRGTDNTWKYEFRSPGGTVISIKTASTYSTISNTGWNHLLFSTKRTSGDLVTHIFVNDVDDAAAPTTNVTGNIDWTRTNFAIGADESGGSKLNADMFDLWITDEYIDFSVEANRRKFISVTGKPVFLGADGSLPTGNIPLVFQHLDNGEAATNFRTNAGDGGGFTETGALTTASTSPTD